MDQLTYKILSLFYNNTLYNWDAIHNLVRSNADFYEYTVEQAQAVFNRLKERNMIASINLGNAYTITEQGKRLYNESQAKFGSTHATAVYTYSSDQTVLSKVMNNVGTRHMNKEDFFYLLNMRLHAYHEALTKPNGPNMILSVVPVWEAYYNKLRQLDGENQLFSGLFWGYGINRISDGKRSWEQPDVSEIRLFGGLNKHHESYRKLQLLVFQVKENILFVSTFSIDSLSFKWDANLLEPYPLKEFKFAKRVIRNQYISVEFHFNDLVHPFRFDIETFHKGGCLASNELADYYVKGMEYLAGPYKQNSVTSATPRRSFLADFIEGIKALEEDDENAECIRIHRAGTYSEASFRNYFMPWFKARGYEPVAEPEKGRGYLDLKVIDRVNGNKIVEFKGWWNDRKDEVIQQLRRYLTSFEGDGYIFMINDLKSSIVDRYRQMICLPELNYVEGSWQLLKYGNTEYQYYVSEYETLQGLKKIYHFIFNVFI